MSETPMATSFFAGMQLWTANRKNAAKAVWKTIPREFRIRMALLQQVAFRLPYAHLPGFTLHTEFGDVDLSPDIIDTLKTIDQTEFLPDLA